MLRNSFCIFTLFLVNTVVYLACNKTKSLYISVLGPPIHVMRVYTIALSYT